MTRYTVRITETAVYTVTVDAENEAQAIELGEADHAQGESEFSYVEGRESDASEAVEDR